ncbi:hypothetical protein [Microbacterium sp. NPDC056052]|uniref:hypothetical protein n=1 Tax=Microbacterium sp. NPDC056052 TaxID=3345695 RepID=UPI0035D587A1
MPEPGVGAVVDGDPGITAGLHPLVLDRGFHERIRQSLRDQHGRGERPGGLLLLELVAERAVEQRVREDLVRHLTAAQDRGEAVVPVEAESADALDRPGGEAPLDRLQARLAL